MTSVDTFATSHQVLFIQSHSASTTAELALLSSPHSLKIVCTVATSHQPTFRNLLPSEGLSCYRISFSRSP